MSLASEVRSDFRAVLANDPAARGAWAAIEVATTYPGFHAVMLHRVNHRIYRLGLPFVPRFVQFLNRLFTGVDFHPAARVGPGLFIDHAHGVVIGETAVIGRNCTLFHQVTLGGTGRQTGKRHPTLRDNIVVGTGAKVLGNITIGNNVYVGANSVVLSDVPDNSTVVGIPGRIVRSGGEKVGARAMDHVHMPDPIKDRFLALEARIAAMESGDAGADPVILPVGGRSTKEQIEAGVEQVDYSI